MLAVGLHHKTPLTSLSLGSTIESCRNLTKTKFFSFRRLFLWVAFLFCVIYKKQNFFALNLHSMYLFVHMGTVHVDVHSYRLIYLSLKLELLIYGNSGLTFSWFRSARKTLLDLYTSSWRGSCQYSAWTRLQWIERNIINCPSLSIKQSCLPTECSFL